MVAFASHYRAKGKSTRGLYNTTTGSRLQRDDHGTFNYDFEGHRTTRARIAPADAPDYVTVYNWDHRDRLTGVTFENKASKVTQRVSYTYDAFDRPIGRGVDDDGDLGPHKMTYTYTVYQGDNPLLELSDADGLSGG